MVSPTDAFFVNTQSPYRFGGPPSKEMATVVSQHDVESALYREWPRLRTQGLPNQLLPDHQTRQWMHRHGRVGYATLDYRLQRHVELPGAKSEGPAGVASLLEQYWSVRTLDGGQDPNWMPSLNVHVVHIRPRAVTSADVEELLRNAIVVQSAARMAGQRGFSGDPQRAELYVRALLLGVEVGNDVAVFDAMETLQDIQFRAAAFRFSVADGFSFTPLDATDRFSKVGIFYTTEIKQLGERLISDDTLPSHDWIWSGTNDGPVYDHKIGLTVHSDGRIV